MNDRIKGDMTDRTYGKSVNLAQFFDEEDKDIKFDIPVLGVSKQCIDCGNIYPLNLFSSKRSNLDKRDCICKKCKNLRLKELRDIKRTAPPRPDVCDCCGKKVEYNPTRLKMGMCCDHDKRTKMFRGWVCNECNLGIGMLGDTIEAIEKVYNYMKERTIVD